MNIPLQVGYNSRDTAYCKEEIIIFIGVFIPEYKATWVYTKPSELCVEWNDFIHTISL